MDYEKTESFHGNPDKALDCAKNIFMAQNFKVTTMGRSELQAENTTTVMNNRQNPLLFISQATITVIGSEIALRAEFGAIRRFLKMLTILMLVFAIPGDIVAVGAMVMTGQPAILGVLIGLAVVLPLPIILPAIAITMRMSARKALDALLHNMGEAARQ